MELHRKLGYSPDRFEVQVRENEIKTEILGLIARGSIQRVAFEDSLSELSALNSREQAAIVKKIGKMSFEDSEGMQIRAERDISLVRKRIANNTERFSEYGKNYTTMQKLSTEYIACYKKKRPQSLLAQEDYPIGAIDELRELTQI